MKSRRSIAQSLIAAVVISAAAAAPAAAVDKIGVVEGFGGMNAYAGSISAPDANGVRYVGGAFTRYRQLDTGSSIVTDPATGAVDRTFARIANGSAGGSGVNTAIPDGSGGYYVGLSDPNTIDGVEVSCAAHIKADGTLDEAWQPGVDGQVTSMLLSDGTLYLGGQFWTVGGQERNNLAAVDASTGAVTSWAPTTDSTVLAMAKSGSSIFIGGNFGKVNGTTRVGIAEVTTDGSLGALSTPTSNYGQVSALLLSDGVLYAGGMFTSLGGVSRSNLAAINISSRTVTSWNPSANGGVQALAAVPGDSTRMIAGGWFSTIGGQSRYGIASVGTNGTVGSWNPDITDQNNFGVSSIAAVQDGSDVNVYFVGPFKQVQGSERMEAAAVKLSDASLTGWDPDIGYRNGDAAVVAALGSKVMVGGKFSAAGGIRRQHLAAFDADGNLTDWNPGIQEDITDSNYPNSWVQSLLLDGETLYVSGSFSSIGSPSASRTNFAALSTTDGSVKQWAPSSSGYATAMAKLGSSIYMVGSLSSVGGQTRYGAASVDATTGSVGTWAPMFSTSPLTIATNGTNLYMGGAFSQARTQGTYSWVTRNGLAAFDTSGTLLSFNPLSGGYPSPEVRALAYDSSAGNLYIGGKFSSVTGAIRRSAAAIKLSDGTVTAWDPRLNEGLSTAPQVYSISLRGSSVMLGGVFTTASGQPRNMVAAFSTSGTLSDWDPKIADGPYYDQVSAVSLGAKALVFGQFDAFNDIKTSGMALLDGPPADAPAPPAPTLSGTPASPTNATSASISFSSTGASSFTCSVDGGAYEACASPKDLTGLADGSHTLSVKAVGSSSTSDATAATWTVDTTAPGAPSLSGTPAALTNSTTASPSFSGEAGSSFTCSLDGGAYLPCASPASISGLAAGVHSFSVKQTDAAGNTGSAVTASWTIDRTPPDAPIVTSGPSGSTPDPRASIGWTGEAGATFQCRLDSGSWFTCASPQSRSDIGLGTHTFRVRATDAAGNTGAEATRTWTVISAPVVAPSISTAVKLTAQLRKDGSSNSWFVNVGQVFAAADTRSSSQLQTVQISTLTKTAPSNSDPIPAKPTYASGIVAFASPEVKRPGGQPTWVRVGNKAGKWTNWVKVTLRK